MVRKALCVAVTYSDPYTAEQLQNYNSCLTPLPGAHYDALEVRKLLMDHYHYHADHIKILVDTPDTPQSHHPTHANIIHAMKELVHGAKQGDHFVFHFSGHASQVENENHTEEDGLDEVLWPSDIQVEGGEPRNYIIDDTVKEILADHLPYGSHFTFILDCCHSGTASDMPYQHSDHFHDNQGIRRRHCHCRKFSIQNSPAFVTSWSACKDSEITLELPGSAGGLFVQSLVHTLEQPWGRKLSNEELLHHITIDIDRRIKAGLVTTNSRGYSDSESLCFHPQLGTTLCDYNAMLKETFSF